MSENDPAPATDSDGSADHKTSRLSPGERRLLTGTGACLTVAAAIVQVAGTNGESPARSITLAAITITVGAAVLIGITRLVARAENLCHLGRCITARRWLGLASGIGRACVGRAWGAMIFGLWA